MEVPEKILKKKYVSKRIKCEYCEKQFNKNETHRKHIETVHKANVISHAESGSNKEIPPKRNLTLQKMFTRQMAIKTQGRSGDHNN